MLVACSAVHDVLEGVEARLRDQWPYATVFSHPEPAEDPRSFDDTWLDRRHRIAS